MTEWDQGIMELDKQYDKLYIEAMRERIVAMETKIYKLSRENDRLREQILTCSGSCNLEDTVK
jgi:hypothetical protein